MSSSYADRDYYVSWDDFQRLAPILTKPTLDNGAGTQIIAPDCRPYHYKKHNRVSSSKGKHAANYTPPKKKRNK